MKREASLLTKVVLRSAGVVRSPGWVTMIMRVMEAAGAYHVSLCADRPCVSALAFAVGCRFPHERLILMDHQQVNYCCSYCMETIKITE